MAVETLDTFHRTRSNVYDLVRISTWTLQTNSITNMTVIIIM